MKRVAVFGNAGGGKSTLAKRLAELTRLPLYPLDIIQFPGGIKVSHEEYLKMHADLLRQEEWIIDGLAVLLPPGSGSLGPTRCSTLICRSSRTIGW
jgi:adenylate kinase family enzyme